MKKLKKFRHNENPLSTAFTKKLNDMVENIDHANNLKLSITGGTGGVKNNFKGRNLRVNIPRISGVSTSVTTEGGSATITYVEISESPSYPANNNISKYTVTSDLDNPSATSTLEIDSVIGFGTGLDMRDFIPWFKIGTILPVVTIGEDVYFMQTLTYVGDSTARSIAWLEDVDLENNTPRAAAVFR